MNVQHRYARTDRVVHVRCSALAISTDRAHDRFPPAVGKKRRKKNVVLRPGRMPLRLLRSPLGCRARTAIPCSAPLAAIRKLKACATSEQRPRVLESQSMWAHVSDGPARSLTSRGCLWLLPRAVRKPLDVCRFDYTHRRAVPSARFVASKNTAGAAFCAS